MGAFGQIEVRKCKNHFFKKVRKWFHVNKVAKKDICFEASEKKEVLKKCWRDDTLFVKYFFFPIFHFNHQLLLF